MSKPNKTVTGSDNSSVITEIATISQPETMTLETIGNTLKAFMSLPCYGLLLQVSANLSISLFVDSPKNTSPLKNSRKLFVASKFDHDLTAMIAAIPQTIAKPVLSDDDAFNDEAVSVWRESMARYKEIGGDVHNKPILALQDLIKSEAIITRYNNLQRVLVFLSDKQDSQFVIPVWEREIITKLSEIPKEIKDLFVECHKNAFQYDPTITKNTVKKDVIIDSKLLHTFDQSVANFDSFAGVCNIVAQIKAHDATKKDTSFFNNGLNAFIDLYSQRQDFNPFVMAVFMRKFDSNTGSKQNIGQTSDSFKDLF